MKLRSSIPLLLLSLALVAGAVAQFQLRGTIGGLVTDITGAVIVNATVTLTDLERNQSTVAQTNDGGLFSFPNLVAGNYQVSVEQEGFKTGVSDIVVITTNDNVRVDIAMEIGDVTETVEVTTAAPLIQTEQTVVGQVVDETLVEALPALGRNFLAFSTLAPNVSSFPRTGAANATWSVGSHHTVGGIAVQVGGGGDNGLYMNGVNINDSWLGGTQYSPSMENVQEVKVDTANFSAASGRDISMTSVMTKAGTNRIPRRPLQLPPERGLECLESVYQGRVGSGPEAGQAPAQPVRRQHRGPGTAKQGVLLLRLRRHGQQQWQRGFRLVRRQQSIPCPPLAKSGRETTAAW